MRLSMQLLCIVWIASISTFLCSGTPLSSSGKISDASLTGTSIHSPTFIEPAESYEDKESEKEIEDNATEYDGEGDGETKDEEEEEKEEEQNRNKEPSMELFADFDDSDDLEVLAKGILGSNNNKESVVPCFGTWWPSTGGYVYYYEDYGNGGTDTGDTGGDDYGGDYSRRRRNRRTRRRRRMRRNRAKRARTSKKAAKKKA